MGFLSGKRALIVGLATDRSIAWGIAQAMHAQGAELAFAHIERMTDRVVPLAKQLGSDITFVMDVASDEEISRGFAHLKTRWDAFDILVHAVAFAPREALTGNFLDATTREGFRVAHDISSYSFTALARASLPFMQGRPGSMVSLSYLGALRSIPGYNVMGLAKASLEANVRFLAADMGPHGIRVNAISAGPIKTLSAAGIPVSFFGLFTLPDFVHRDDDLFQLYVAIHKWLGYVLILLIFVHAGAALRHHFVFKDETLRKMLP